MKLLLFYRRFSLRHARQEWLQTVLLLLILGLGVGAFLSIRIANRAAVQGFQLFTDSLNGPSDWILQSPGGGLPVDRLAEIRDALDPLPARIIPVLERNLHRQADGAAAFSTDGPAVRLLGLDLVQMRALAEGGGADATGLDFRPLLDDPAHLLVGPQVAAAWGVTVGDPVRCILGGREEGFVIRGILPELRGATPLPRNLAIVDIAALLQRLGADSVDRVEILLPDSPDREQQVRSAGERLQTVFGGEWRLGSPVDQRVDGASMTAAFRLNLTVLSLIALLVGMYLIAQTLDATVSRRRREIATLRSLGVSPGGIFRLWLAEAALYGLAAGLAGLLIGGLLANLTVEAVTTTVRALYRDTAQTAIGLNSGDVLLAFALGLGGSIAAAWLPARDAASTPPAQFLRLGKRIPPFPLFQHPWIGTAALAAGTALLLLPPWRPQPGVAIPVAGYAAAFLWLTGGTLVAAAAVKAIGRLMHWAGRDHAPLRLAGSRLRKPTSRHQLALAGFFVAIAMAASMSFLINSFEHTVTRWLEQRLRADLFISSIGFQGSDTDQRMPAAILDQVEAMPEVAAMDRFRSLDMRINGMPAALGGVRFDLLGGRQELLWLDGPLDPATAPDNAAPAFANENLVRRAGLRIGNVVPIPTPAGERRLWIAGIHADYARDNGLLLVDLPLIEEWYRISDYETASVFLAPGADPAAVQARLRTAHPGLAVRGNAELMEAALFIFHQTFAVTRALQLIGLAVALGGLVLSLLSLLRESGRELSLQRVLGMRRHEIAMTTALEGTGIALTGLLAGAALSGALGLALIHVINRQSFGWTLQAAFPWSGIALLGAAVVALGFLVSHATGWLHLRKWKPEPL
jgi:putative ABC transport system permease protein